MRVNHFVAVGQAESVVGFKRFGRKEGVADIFQMRFGNAMACIAE